MKYPKLRILKKAVLHFLTLFRLPRPISQFDFRRLPTHYAKTGHICNAYFKVIIITSYFTQVQLFIYYIFFILFNNGLGVKRKWLKNTVFWSDVPKCGYRKNYSTITMTRLQVIPIILPYRKRYWSLEWAVCKRSMCPSWENLSKYPKHDR